MKIIVLGGSGFIGSHLRKASKTKHEFLFIGRSAADEISTRQFSSREFHTKVESFQGEVILDLATHFNLYPSYNDFDKLVEGSLTFHIQMFRELEAYNLPWVYTSSFWQRRKNENEKAISDYHFLKESIEKYLFQESSAAVVSISLMDTYGRDDPRKKIVNLLMNLSPNSVPLELSEGNQLLNLLHVEDAASGLLTACDFARWSKENESFDLLAEEFTTLKSLAEQIQVIRNVELPISWGARPYRPGELFEVPNNLRPLPSWVANFTLTEGLASLLN